MPNHAMPVQRGCGTRVAGGIYWELGTSPDGLPIESFLVCPPVRIDKNALGISDVGVHQIGHAPAETGAHFVDIVGAGAYPNVADFIEEARRFGFSRRLPPGLDFSKVGPASRLLLAHRRAAVRTDQVHEYYWPADGTGFGGCARVKAGIERPGTIARQTEDGLRVVSRTEPFGLPTCCGVWWDDLDAGQPFPDDPDTRKVRRAMPSFTYEGRGQPYGVHPKYDLAIFASIPLGRVAVVEDPEGKHEATVAMLKARGVSPVIVPE